MSSNSEQKQVGAAVFNDAFGVADGPGGLLASFLDRNALLRYAQTSRVGRRIVQLQFVSLKALIVMFTQHSLRFARSPQLVHHRYNGNALKEYQKELQQIRDQFSASLLPLLDPFSRDERQLFLSLEFQGFFTKLKQREPKLTRIFQIDGWQSGVMRVDGIIVPIKTARIEEIISEYVGNDYVREEFARREDEVREEKEEDEVREEKEEEVEEGENKVEKGEDDEEEVKEQGEIGVKQKIKEFFLSRQSKPTVRLTRQFIATLSVPGILTLASPLQIDDSGRIDERTPRVIWDGSIEPERRKICAALVENVVYTLFSSFTANETKFLKQLLKKRHLSTLKKFFQFAERVIALRIRVNKMISVNTGLVTLKYFFTGQIQPNPRAGFVYTPEDVHRPGAQQILRFIHFLLLLVQRHSLKMSQPEEAITEIKLMYQQLLMGEGVEGVEGVGGVKVAYGTAEDYDELRGDADFTIYTRLLRQEGYSI